MYHTCVFARLAIYGHSNHEIDITIEFQSTPGGVHEESMRSGLDWRRLEKDWRWTDCGLEVDFVDEMGTGGGLHKDPWGSVRYRPWAMICHQEII